jgi:hypothetical protein
MTKIKFIDARLADPDEDEFALKRRFELHLRELRALREGGPRRCQETSKMSYAGTRTSSRCIARPRLAAQARP